MASSLRYQKICLAVIRIAKDRRREIKMKKNNQPKYQKKSVIYIPTQLGSRRLRLYSKRLVLISMSFVLDLGRHALSRLISIVTIMMLLSCMCQHLSQSWGFCLLCVSICHNHEADCQKTFVLYVSENFWNEIWMKRGTVGRVCIQLLFTVMPKILSFLF